MTEDPDKVYRDWYSKQTEQRRKELDAAGLSPVKAELRRRPDHYELTERSWREDAKDFDDTSFADDQTRLTTPMFTQEQMNRAIITLIQSIEQTATEDATRLHILCYKIAIGIDNPPTQANIARQFGYTRAGVCFRVKAIQRQLGIPPSQHMRSERVCEKYRSRAHAVHKRRKASGKTAKPTPDKEKGKAKEE